MKTEVTVLKTQEKGRFGFINFHQGGKDETAGQERTIDVPSLLVYTRYGRVPHLTEDTERCSSARHTKTIRRLRLSELFEDSVSQSLKASGKGYRRFTNSGVTSLNSQDNPILFCSVQDTRQFAAADIPKYAEEKSISVWTQSGRRKVTPEDFMEALSMAGIEIAESLCDSPPLGAGEKRCKKSVDRTLRHLDRCIEIAEANPEKYNFALFGAVVGGSNTNESRRSAVETSKRKVQGFVLEGFDQIDADFNEHLRMTMELLPPEKPKVLLGSFNPGRTFEAILNGIDVIDNSYVYELTERGCASVFAYRIKKPKIGPEHNPTESGTKSMSEIQLNEKRYKNDFQPIVDTCSCMTCLKYTRSYLNHLLVTNEMLAQVLLMIHNMHHYEHFVEEIRLAMNEMTLENLKEILACT